MPKSTTTFFLAFISFCSNAQKPGLTLEKIGLKYLQREVSYIPTKTFTSLSYNGSDSLSNYRSRYSSVKSFYISKAEVTNREYREFVYYIRDSTAHSLLAHFTSANTIDWSQKINWDDKQLAGMMISMENNYSGKKEIDPEKITWTINYFGHPETISVYPDTLTWIRDFKFSYNEPLVKKYFAHEEYDNYPVVGINIKQAMAFCEWKTGQVMRSLKTKDTSIQVQVELPTNAEWESAAFEDRDSTLLSTKGKVYHYNFGNIIDGNRVTIKSYKDDGYFYTSPVKSYKAGLYGLYDMKGNVAEWTLTSMEEVMNAEVKAGRQKSLFVAKGGGWNSTPFYLQAGACQFLPANEAHSYIGFRYVVHVKNK
ncbi:MAG TPA: SUMF1/EgtB/PvdO family nonheme iron enzyme [Chitinophagaceae bacterium]|nr:SUMF1/EgtB/PvdO family nonheme iron enzyme [Chitinophagaceae bacterium]